MQKTARSLKIPENRFTRYELKVRKALGVILILLGFATLILSLMSWVAGAHSLLTLTVTIILGAFFIVVGILIFVIEMFESWLSNGQAALVDGLQAG